jgi:hypothetical protein
MTTYSYNQEWWNKVKVNYLEVDFNVEAAVKRTMVGVTSLPSVSGHYGSFFGSSAKHTNYNPQHNQDTPKMNPKKPS